MRPLTVPLLAHAGALGLGAWMLGHRPTPGSGAGRQTGPGRDSGPLSGPKSGSGSGSGSPVAVIIPARDEEASLPHLLASLAAQTRRPGEVIVVDDHSSDATAEVASAAGARVIANPAIPKGWLGKPWAAYQGASASGAEVLVFLDADVRLGPDALSRLLDEHAHHGGVVSVQPSHHPERAHEQLSLVCNLVTMMGTGAFRVLPRSMPTMAFGPCLVLSRADYERCGGHAHPSVRGEVAEDIALARRMRALGAPVRLLAGGDQISFRMYPRGPAQMAEGWTKMLATGARRGEVGPTVAVGVWVTAALLGAARAPAAIFGRTLGGQRLGRGERLGSAALYLAWAGEMEWLGRRVGRWRPWAALAFPLPLVTFVALFARSARLATSGRPARWRGRAVPVH